MIRILANLLQLLIKLSVKILTPYTHMSNDQKAIVPFNSHMSCTRQSHGRIAFITPQNGEFQFPYPETTREWGTSFRRNYFRDLWVGHALLGCLEYHRPIVINACVHKPSQKSMPPKHVLILPNVSEGENNVWSFIFRNSLKTVILPWVVIISLDIFMGKRIICHHPISQITVLSDCKMPVVKSYLNLRSCFLQI